MGVSSALEEADGAFTRDCATLLRVDVTVKALVDPVVDVADVVVDVVVVAAAAVLAFARARTGVCECDGRAGASPH